MLYSRNAYHPGWLLILTLWLSGHSAYAQELIPNGGFEKYTTCPYQDNLLSEAAPWYNPNRATPDFYHRCLPTNQMQLPPHSGQGIGRLFMDQGWAEYFGTPLLSPLIAGEAYQFEMALAAEFPARYPSRSFGAYFSAQPLMSTDKILFPVRPQVYDTQVKTFTKAFTWEIIAGCFVAKGGEQFATIGNFNELPPLLSAYYLFADDISLKQIKLNLGNDTTLCGRASRYRLSARTPGATDYRWSDGSTDSVFVVKRPGKYWVTVKTPCKVLSDTIVVKYRLDFSLGNDTTLCTGATLALSVSTPASGYNWQDGSTKREFTVRQPGTYRVSATEPGCSASDTIVIRYIEPPRLSLGPPLELCGAETHVLRPVFAQGKFSWVDGYPATDRLITSSNTYYGQIVNDCMTLIDSVKADYGECGCVLYTPDLFTPNNDGVNDWFEPFACGDITITGLSVFNRWGEVLYQTQAAPFRWDGAYRNQPCDTDIYAWAITYQLNQQGRISNKRKQGLLRLAR